MILKTILLVLFAVFCGACRQQTRLEREMEIQLEQERKLNAYWRSPEYKKKMQKALDGTDFTKKDLDNLKVP